MYILLILIIAISVLILIENKRERRTFRVTSYEVYSEKISTDTKVVFLTDLHNKEYDRGNQKIIQSIRKLKPDFVLIGGDMVLGIDEQPVKIACELIAELVRFTKVYYANGNHEQRVKEHVEKYGDFYENYKKILVDLGVTMLENESLLVGDDLEIAGVEIPEKYYVKFCKEKLQIEEIEERITKKDTERFQILMAHNPTFSEQYVKWGADLVLSGHYHGGMIRIPYYGGVINPQARLFPKYTGGHYHIEGKDVIVSKGLGEHTVKIRICNWPEIVVIHMKSK